MATQTSAKTLAQQGFRMPAEWEPHAGTWIAWPYSRPGQQGHPHWPHTFQSKNIPRYWAMMARHLTGEDVHILAHQSSLRAEITDVLEQEQPGLADDTRIHIHEVPNNWPWTRDSGGITLVDARGRRVMTNWQFNAWGYGRWAYDLDNEVPRSMSRICGIPSHDLPLVLEGGSIDVNGRGSLLTTEACLLNPNRNLPGQSRTRDEIEQALADNLGATNVLWLGEGIGGDDTSGHVDDLTRFIGPATVLTVIETNSHDENYTPLRRNAQMLRTMRDQDGRQLTIVEVPLPKPQVYREERMPASYANFYIGNEAVLAPVFDDPNDRHALAVLQQAFPDRRIVGIDARDLVWGLGSFHCLTQQEPAAHRASET